MEQNIPTSTVLNLAADAIQMGGWQQGGSGVVDPWGDGGGPMCLEGGIMAAMGLRLVGGIPPDGFVFCPAYEAVEDYLGLEGAWLFSWNDRQGRTAEEVIEVLRAAALVEAAREEAAARLPGEPHIYETDDQPLPIEVAA